MNIREFRSVSPKQSEFLDACFATGAHKSTKRSDNATRLRYVLGGGAGFGGKSYCIRTGIVEFAMRMNAHGVHQPRQLVICKTMVDLEERQIAEIDRDTHYPTGSPNPITEFGRLTRTALNYFKFEFTGAYSGLGVVEFRHGGNLNRRRGAQYNAIWVDELTQFSEEEFGDILYMLRSTQGELLLFAGVTNPDGPGNSWVKKLWVDRDYSDTKLPGDRFFYVPFRFEDNPAANEDARIMLLSLSPEKIRSRYYGEWDLLTGSRFSSYSRTFNSFTWDQFSQYYAGDPGFSPKEILRTPGLFNIVGSLDYGTSLDSASAYYMHAIDGEGRIWTFGELYMSGLALPDQADAIIDHEGDLPVMLRLCDPALRGGDTYYGRNRIMAFEEQGLTLVPGMNSRIEGWEAMDYALYWKANPDNENQLIREPKWRIHDGCVEAHAFLRNAPRCAIKSGDIDSKFKKDHAGDSCRYGIAHLVAPEWDTMKSRNDLKAKAEAGSEEYEPIPEAHRPWR